LSHWILGKNGGPRRYKTLQKWLENAENTKKPQLQLFPTGTDEPKLLTQDSCLWAYVEDISSLMHKNVDTAGKRKDLENRERAGLGRSFDWRIYPHKCGQLVVASDDRTAARDFSLRLYYSLSYANCLELIT